MKLTWKSKKLKRILKTTGITLCTISLTGAIALESYNLYLESKLDDIEISKEQVQTIENYYDSLEQEPVIFAMNDSQGMNLNVGFWKNSYPEYLEEELNATLIDISSLRFNKTSHIDILLENNLSVAELKELNNQGTYVAMQKVAADINLSFLKNMFGTAGNLMFGQKIQDADNNVYISDLLKDTKEPIIVYSSGANDLMFLANANPTSLKKYDSQGNTTNQYLYAENMLSDPNTTKSVISSIEQNFCNILSINPTAKIFVLSIYVPKSLEEEGYQVFFQAITQYNIELESLCEKYNICFVDETELGKTYNQSQSNFHINEIGHKKLASLLIDEISKSCKKTVPNQYEYDNYKYSTNGLDGYYKGLVEEVQNIPFLNERASAIYPYSADVYLRQREEKMKDAETCKKLIKKENH